MSQVWCVISESSEVAEIVSDRLIDAGHSVALPSFDVSPLAMLVNRRYDAVLPIELVEENPGAMRDAIVAIEESFGPIDVFGIVIEPSMPPRVAAIAEAFARLQPDASVVLITGNADDDKPQREAQRELNVALEARIRAAMDGGTADPRRFSVVEIADLAAYAAHV